MLDATDPDKPIVIPTDFSSTEKDYLPSAALYHLTWSH